MSFKITCECCGPDSTLMSFSPGVEQTSTNFGRAWKSYATAFASITCAGCGSSFGLQDDGVPAEQGGSVVVTNVSRPKITSVDISGGPREGSTVVVLRGLSLDVGKLRVFFGNKEATVGARTSTTANVVAPPGNYVLLSSPDPIIACDISNITGTFTVGEMVSSLSPPFSGTLQRIQGSRLFVELPAATNFDNISGRSLSGAISGATTTINNVDLGLLTPGETITGVTNGSQGTLISRDSTRYVVDRPNGPFSAGELVYGETSNSYIKLSSPSYSGKVDIIVENDYGRRPVDFMLVDGFTYS